MFSRTSVVSPAIAVLATALFVFTGCSSVSPTTNASALSGNWQISSTATQAARLPSLSGSLAQTGTAITGILHADTASACIAPNMPIAVTGTANAQSQVTFSGANVAGGAITVTGTLAPDGKSLLNATYTVTGGSCAFVSPADAHAQFFSDISGTYTGSFSDGDGQVITLAASLTQTPASDGTGNFQLSGTGTFPNNPCFVSPVSISNSQVTGGSFTLTYNDAQTLNSVTASGTFSNDGLTLTVTNWALTGSCGPDSGTGLLTRQ